MNNFKEELKKELLNKQCSFLELSRELTGIETGIENIREYGEWEEIIESKSLIFALDNRGENHALINFEVIYKNADDEVPQATIIKIMEVYYF